MQSKNKKAPNKAEKAHIERLARESCVVCETYDSIEIHEPEQGLWFASMPLCTACHRGPEGWHGTRLRWKLRKMDELKAINRTWERLHA